MFIATASTTIKFHEFPSGNLVHNYQPGTKVEGTIRTISWSKDGNWLVLVPFSGLIEIISVKDKLKLLKTIQNVDEPTCASFQNSTKKYLAMGTSTGLVLIYDTKSRSTKKRFQRVSSPITHVEFTANDTHCLAACKNGDVMMYNNVLNNPPCTLRIPKSKSVNCLRTSKVKRNLVIGGSNEGVVCVWDTNVNKCKFQVEAHNAPVNAVVFSPVNSDLIVTAGSDRQCYFFDVVDNKCIATLTVDNSITSVDFSPDGMYFSMGAQNGNVFIYDSRNIQSPVKSFQAHNTSVRHLSFQTSLDLTTSVSECEVSAESTPAQSTENLHLRKRRSSDLFELLVPTTVTCDEHLQERKRSAVSEAGDSFLGILGLDNRNSTVEDSAFATKCLPRLPSIVGEDSPLAADPEKKFTSTPVTTLAPTTESGNPRTTDNSAAALNDRVMEEISGVQAGFRETVREEVKAAAAEIRADVEYQAMHTTHQLRCMLLDIQMAMVKEFIKMENYCNCMKEVVAAGAAGCESDERLNVNAAVFEENERLRRRVEFLEEQLRNASLDRKEGDA